MNDIDLDLERIEYAARTIDPVFLHSPQFADEQLSREIGNNTVIKLETANPLRSFKGRGTDFLAGQLNGNQTVVCASAGNFGQAMAYAGRSRGIEVEVFVDDLVNPVKIERMRQFGATVTLVSGQASFETARNYAEQHDNRVLIEDGRSTAIAEGAGTIGVELLTEHDFDTVVVPVGDGALINGIARWIKAHREGIRVVGVGVDTAPAMAGAWRTGEVVDGEPTDTIAETIATWTPIQESIHRMRALVDDFVLVTEDSLLDAMRLCADTVGVLLEPAGAAGIAAIRTCELAGDRFATVLTGSNPRPELVSALLNQ